eukprot:Clim_evm39s22 gene=Clim_evmTU39s22
MNAETLRELTERSLNLGDPEVKSEFCRDASCPMYFNTTGKDKMDGKGMSGKKHSKKCKGKGRRMDHMSLSEVWTHFHGKDEVGSPAADGDDQESSQQISRGNDGSGSPPVDSSWQRLYSNGLSVTQARRSVSFYDHNRPSKPAALRNEWNEQYKQDAINGSLREQKMRVRFEDNESELPLRSTFSAGYDHNVRPSHPLFKSHSFRDTVMLCSTPKRESRESKHRVSTFAADIGDCGGSLQTFEPFSGKGRRLGSTTEGVDFDERPGAADLHFQLDLQHMARTVADLVCSNPNAGDELPDLLPRDALTQVTRLNLRRMNLENLPGWLKHFRNLKHLNLASNRFRSIPEVLLCGVKNHYHQDQLLDQDGKAPKSCGCRLGFSLEDLILSHNQMRELVTANEDLGVALPNLKLLRLDGNRLTSLPDSLGNLTQLETLVCGSIYGGNRITVLPHTVGQCDQLRELDVRRNELVSLPKTMGELVSLHTLNVSRNNLENVADVDFRGMTSLLTVDLSHNRLRRIPETIADNPTLRLLDVSNNAIDYLPTGFHERVNPQATVLMQNNPLMEDVIVINNPADNRLRRERSTGKEGDRVPTLMQLCYQQIAKRVEEEQQELVRNAAQKRRSSCAAPTAGPSTLASGVTTTHYTLSKRPSLRQRTKSESTTASMSFARSGLVKQRSIVLSVGHRQHRNSESSYPIMETTTPRPGMPLQRQRAVRGSFARHPTRPSTGSDVNDTRISLADVHEHIAAIAALAAETNGDIDEMDDTDAGLSFIGESSPSEDDDDQASAEGSEIPRDETLEDIEQLDIALFEDHDAVRCVVDHKRKNGRNQDKQDDQFLGIPRKADRDECLSESLASLPLELQKDLKDRYRTCMTCKTKFYHQGLTSVRLLSILGHRRIATLSTFCSIKCRDANQNRSPYISAEDLSPGQQSMPNLSEEGFSVMTPRRRRFSVRPLPYTAAAAAAAVNRQFRRVGGTDDSGAVATERPNLRW